MAETTPGRRSPFIIAGEWSHVFRRNRSNRRVIRWPKSESPQSVEPSPTNGVLAFMKWIRERTKQVEKHQARRQALARAALQQTTKRLRR